MYYDVVHKYYNTKPRTHYAHSYIVKQPLDIVVVVKVTYFTIIKGGKYSSNKMEIALKPKTLHFILILMH